MWVVCAQCASSARKSTALRAAGPPVVLRRAVRAQHGFVAQWERVDFALASVTCEDCVQNSLSFQPPRCSKSSPNRKNYPKILETSDGGVRLSEGRQLPPSEAAAAVFQTLAAARNHRVTKTTFSDFNETFGNRGNDGTSDKSAAQSKVIGGGDNGSKPVIDRESLAADCARSSRDETFQKAKLGPHRPAADGTSLWRGEHSRVDQKTSIKVSEAHHQARWKNLWEKGILQWALELMSPHFLTRDKSGAFVKSWLWSLVEWENETREADPKQTWPEDLVSWPSLNLRGFLPSDARPIISDSGFLSLLTKKHFSVYLLPSCHHNLCFPRPCNGERNYCLSSTNIFHQLAYMRVTSQSFWVLCCLSLFCPSIYLCLHMFVPAV